MQTRNSKMEQEPLPQLQPPQQRSPLVLPLRLLVLSFA